MVKKVCACLSVGSVGGGCCFLAVGICVGGVVFFRACWLLKFNTYELYVSSPCVWLCVCLSVLSVVVVVFWLLVFVWVVLFFECVEIWLVVVILEVILDVIKKTRKCKKTPSRNRKDFGRPCFLRFSLL